MINSNINVNQAILKQLYDRTLLEHLGEFFPQKTLVAIVLTVFGMVTKALE